jgi:hypothetical protein
MRIMLLTAASALGAATLIPSASPAVTLDEVTAALQANTAAIQNCSLVLKRSVKNVGAHGKVLQQFDDQHVFAIDKAAGRVKQTKGGDEQLWDCSRGKYLRKVKGGVSEVKFDRPIAEVIPHPLNYYLIPAHVLGVMDISEVKGGGSSVVVVGHSRGTKESKGGERTEVQINLARGVVDQVRTYDSQGRLIADVKAEGWTRYGGGWLPKRVRSRRISTRNALTIWYTLDQVKVNGEVASPLEIR